MGAADEGRRVRNPAAPRQGDLLLAGTSSEFIRIPAPSAPDSGRPRAANVSTTVERVNGKFG